VGLLLAGVLLHEAHEEDEQDGGGGDADDDRDHHDGPAEHCGDRNVAVAHRDLSDHLVVDAGDEVVEFGVDLAAYGGEYPSTRNRNMGRKR